MARDRRNDADLEYDGVTELGSTFACQEETYSQSVIKVEEESDSQTVHNFPSLLVVRVAFVLCFSSLQFGLKCEMDKLVCSYDCISCLFLCPLKSPP